ncbi:MAG: cupredoxin family copper-binding protein [Anaerolineales bacterium]|nr:MAG: cupredoxin family copper-binding protein [Anaerolineales bacterium]
MNSPIFKRIALATILLLLLSACGGAPAATTEPPAATDHVDQPTEAPTQASAPTEAEEESEDSGGDTVTIANFSFGPGTLTVKAGTTVTWRNNEDAPHTVTADDGSFGSNTLGQGDSFSFTFDTPGTYDYHCQFHGGAGHAGMSGTIVVEE